MGRLEDMDIDDEHGMKSDPEPPHAVVEVSFGVELLLSMLNHPQGIFIWNTWVKSMDDLLNPLCTADTDPPLLASLDFTSGDLRGLSMDGLDLDDVWLEGTDFTASSLKGAKIGFCRHAIFKDADLSNALVDGDVTGVDFTGARMKGVVIQEFCTYQKGSPPIGLHEDLLARCKEVDEPSEAAVSPVGRTIPVGGRLMLMRGGNERGPFSLNAHI